MKLVIIFALPALFLGGCASDKFVGRPGLTVIQEGTLPPPDRTDLVLKQRSYLIGPTDQLSVDVYGAPDLSRSVSVDADGSINLPLVGKIEAAGMTSAELAILISDRLRGKYVRDPQVSVQTQKTNQVVTVDGSVEKPGTYPVVGRMTLMKAVATAEGLSEFANASYVVVFRQVNSQSMAALYDLRAIRQGAYEDPEIYANDVVFVGDAPARRLFKDVLSASGVLAAPLITILQK